MKLMRKILFLDDHVCPWWCGYALDNPLRRLIHDPEKMLRPYLREGMTAADIGCGMGHFSLGMAKLVGREGRVISADLQQRMLDTLHKRAERAGLADRISLQLSEQDDIGITEAVDFVLTFWMAHEVPSAEPFFQQIHSILKSDGKWLLVEPKLHTSSSSFDKTLAIAKEVGFTVTERPPIRISYVAVLEKSD